ncbi:hypothetical protein FHS43_000414 [Streptosporangium becharense]|uniref:Uncharacterized protein n=1 Tax=Streptosporangium becharense TaxID=1816182 RepID=A0A7W9IFP9_9ACTN|nr:hypothetical protein [Streptosporangium becharense]MBB2909168.1 hypothetical protein [Streptosporangium becharense]MBB5819813.1 hypothetical protein [Streptosporangium becharense]
MTGLHDALDDIADEAPLVNLADLAIAGHRRRRRTTLTLTAVAAVTALGVATAAVTLPGANGDDKATPRNVDTVPDLPDGKVESLSHAYQTPCRVDPELRQPLDCSAVEWRVVTGTGTTYRLSQALVRNAKGWNVPVAISRDGRMLAYYSRRAQAHVVRDLVSGSEATSSVTVKEELIGAGSMLVVSDDGRHVIFDPREGSKDPGLLIDMRTGKKVPVPGKFEAISIKDGVAALVRYVRTDLWLMPVTGGGTPVRFDGVFINFSELAPDGRTMAAFEFKTTRSVEKRTLTLLDARTGRTLRKVAVRGLPKDGGVSGASLWVSGSEVTIIYRDTEVGTYAVDVDTGQARQLARYSGKLTRLTLPGVTNTE